MRYFKLVYDFENDDDYVIVKSSNKAEHYDSEIVKGELIENWDKDIKFEYNVEDGKILSDYLASDNGWVIVSKKFRDVVKEIVGENIQYLDINIINSKTKEEDNTYKVANVTKHLEALDLENSVYDFFECIRTRAIVGKKNHLYEKNIWSVFKWGWALWLEWKLPKWSAKGLLY